MTYTFKPATRQNSKVLVGIYGESGCGKTYSSLLLARGIAGDNGKIAMIDTESGRGALYADVIPGGYLHMDLSEPFSPQRYVEAIAAAENAGIDVLVIDSMSHGWTGIGGVLDQAAKIEERTGKPGLHCWKEPKQHHKLMMLKLLQTRMNVICCLRAKYKSKQQKNLRTGKSEIVKDDFTTPEQDEAFIYEMTAHMEIMQNHVIRITKCSHPDLRKCFQDGKPITIATGQNIAGWSSGGAAGDVSPSSAVPPRALTEEEWVALQEQINGAETLESLKAASQKVAGLSDRLTEGQKQIANQLYRDMATYLKRKAEGGECVQRQRH